MPSIKKRVTGFIRQLSAPGGGETGGVVAHGQHGSRATATAAAALRGTSSSSSRKDSSSGAGGGARQSQHAQHGDGFIQRYLSTG